MTRSDPRPQLTAALDQVDRQIDTLSPADLTSATPCPEFDAQTLLAHLVAVLRKLVVVKDGGDMRAVPDPAVDVAGEVVVAFGRARADLERAWSDAASLDPTYTVAWGSMTGRDLLDAYTHEFTVHAWDLAQVTGRGDDLDPDLADRALVWFRTNVPDHDRSADGPFGPAVEVPDDADPYTQLAGFVGRLNPSGSARSSPR